MTRGDYKQLVVRQKAIECTQSIYVLINSFPDSELYGLSSQIKRASISISSNIAEGNGRNTNKDYVHFITMSMGSCFELESQLYLAETLGFIKDPILLKHIFTLINDIKNLLGGLKRSLQNKNS